MGSIKGIVRDQNNTPMQGLNIIIVSGPTHPDIVAITDIHGKFTFTDLRPGNYAVKAYGVTESDDIPVQVIKEKTAFVEIWMETGGIKDTGNVIDEV